MIRIRETVTLPYRFQSAGPSVRNSHVAVSRSRIAAVGVPNNQPHASPGFTISVSPRVFISCWCVLPWMTISCDSIERGSRRRCRARGESAGRRSRSCGATRTARRRSPPGRATTAPRGRRRCVPNTPASDMLRVLERLERERRAEVARMQDHVRPGRLHLPHELGDGRNRSCVSAINPTRIRFLPPLRVGDFASHQVLVRARAP